MDNIEKGQVPPHPDLWIKAGKSYAVPVYIETPGVVLSWEFSTEPKVTFPHSVRCNHPAVQLLLPIHDFRENGSTCITLRQSVSASVRQSVTLLLA